MNVSADQADAMGGCQSCEPAGTTPPAPASTGAAPSVTTVDSDKEDWIGIELKDDAGNPIAGERFLMTLPDGTEIGGELDNLGKARIEGIAPGTCQISFPERDVREWKAG